MFWAFKLSFVVDILAFFAWTLFRLLFEEFGDFFQNYWSPWTHDADFKRGNFRGFQLGRFLFLVCGHGLLKNFFFKIFLSLELSVEHFFSSALKHVAVFWCRVILSTWHFVNLRTNCP
jgi:hypothetical protein